MSENQIGQRAAQAPEITQYEVNAFTKPKVGERGHFEMNLVAEPGPRQLKTATVACSIPGYSPFTLNCDEGTTYYGDDTAPPPLAYLSAGIAFCLLTHMQALMHAHDLKVKNLRVEQRLKYSTTLATTMQDKSAPDGRCDGIETHVVVDSDEPPETIQMLIDHAEAACMAHQTVLRPTPGTMRVVHNGQELANRAANAGD